MQYFMIKYPKFKQLEGRVSVEIVANFEVPKSTKKQDKILMLENKINPIKKPDIDNIVKIILDAMNEIAFKDDTQFTKLNVEKKYSETESVFVKIEEYL